MVMMSIHNLRNMYAMTIQPFMISCSFSLSVCTSLCAATGTLLLRTWWMERAEEERLTVNKNSEIQIMTITRG